MLNEAVVPVGSLLMAQQDVMRGHRILWILLLEVFLQGGRLSREGFGKLHMVNVGWRRGRRGRRLGVREGPAA
jgi:hypothetical protein